MDNITVIPATTGWYLLEVDYAHNFKAAYPIIAWEVESLDVAARETWRNCSPRPITAIRIVYEKDAKCGIQEPDGSVHFRGSRFPNRDAFCAVLYRLREEAKAQRAAERKAKPRKLRAVKRAGK